MFLEPESKVLNPNLIILNPSSLGFDKKGGGAMIPGLQSFGTDSKETW